MMPDRLRRGEPIEYLFVVKSLLVPVSAFVSAGSWLM
jgi:hypothetical protein